MKDVIQFEEWNFLEEHFVQNNEERQQWTRAKREKDQETAEWNAVKATRLQETKIYDLSRKYPAFNEDALPTYKMEGVIKNYG